MVSTILLRGLLAGLVAGLLAFGFAKVFGEPQVDRAIAFESQMEAAHAHSHGDADAHGEELVSRRVQSTFGLLTGVVVYAAALGGLFSLVFAFCLGRIGRLSPRALGLLLAGLGFVAIVLVPALKYPPNPPAVGDPDTIGVRTALYFLMIVISLGATIAAVLISRHFVPRLGAWNAVLVAGAAFLAVIVVSQFLLPDINEVPANFPAVPLWRFRIASLASSR